MNWYQDNEMEVMLNRFSHPVARFFPRLSVMVIAGIVTVGSASVALAEQSQGSAAHGGGHHGPSLILLWFNFLLYVGMMYFLLRKPLASGWRERRSRIDREVNRSQLLLREAEEEYERALQAERGLDQALATQCEEMRAAAMAEGHGIVSAASERAARIAQQSALLVGAERNRQMDTLRRQFADRVAEQVAVLVKEALSDEADATIRTAALRNRRGIALLKENRAQRS